MKKLLTVTCMVVAIVIFEMIYMGNQVNASVYAAENIKISEDGKQVSFNIYMVNSMGQVRTYKDDYKDGEHNLKFLSSWGGFSSAIAAKNCFTVNVNEGDTAINFYHEDGYELAIKKDNSTGDWIYVRPEKESLSENEAE